MKNKIRNVVYSASVAVLTLPVLASAQFETPGGTNLPSNTVSAIVQNAMDWLLWAVGIAGVIGFAIAGILYLTSAGNDTQITKAKNAMLYAIIGVVVALAGLVALNFAEGLLGADQKF